MTIARATGVDMALDFQALWDEAQCFDAFLAAVKEQPDLWAGVYRTAKIPAWAVAAVPAGTRLRLLVLSADWCGDAANTVPVLARFAEATPGVELRVLDRDAYPQVMDRYLTNGSRSIPIAIVLDGAFHELGHWGPRPAELQAWVMANKATMPSEERYPKIRRWYAKDRGETTLRELLATAGLSAA